MTSDLALSLGYTELYKCSRAILERPLTSLLCIDQQ